MGARLREEFELRPVHLKAIDLPMMERLRADDSAGRKELLSRGAEARIARERPIFAEPGADGALRDLAVEAPAHESLGLGQRVPEIERRDGLEDHPERVGPALA